MANYRLFNSICSLWLVLNPGSETPAWHTLFRPTGTPYQVRGKLFSRGEKEKHYATTTGIFPIRVCHSFGPVWCTEVPCESTATVTGMSCTVNS